MSYELHTSDCTAIPIIVGEFQLSTEAIAQPSFESAHICRDRIPNLSS